MRYTIFILWCLTAAALPLAALDNIFFGDKLIRAELKGFQAERISNEPDSFYLTAFAEKTQTALSISLSMDAYADSRTCREFRWAAALRNKIPREHIKQYDYGKFAVVEWDAPSPEGIRKNINAYYAASSLAMTVQVVRRNCPNGKVLLPFLDDIRIGEIPLVYELCFKGKAAFDQENYQQAISFFRPALQSEKKHSELRPREWRDLTVWAGMAEAMTGNLRNAEDVFVNALKKDAKYTLFHYNLACVYAESGRLPAALDELEKALQNRETLDPGQALPNPREDTSFKPFREDPRFKQLLDKYAVGKDTR